MITGGKTTRAGEAFVLEEREGCHYTLGVKSRKDGVLVVHAFVERTPGAEHSLPSSPEDATHKVVFHTFWHGAYCGSVAPEYIRASGRKLRNLVCKALESHLDEYADELGMSLDTFEPEKLGGEDDAEHDL